MSKQQIYACDVCGTQRKETNHWFVAYEGDTFLTLWDWEAAKDSDGVKHLCGHECLQKHVSKWAVK